VINTVAEATEKVTGEVANAFLGNENLKEAASRIKTVMDAIEEDAEKAEAVIDVGFIQSIQSRFSIDSVS